MLIRVIDLETCGLEPPAAICEIGFCDLVSDSEGWHVGPAGHLLVNPGTPIPPETSAVHHIVDADVAEAPGFGAAANAIFWDDERFQAKRVIFVAHNAKFERQWLTPEVTGDVQWICTYKAALRIWPEAPAHNNGTLRYWLNPVGLRRQQAEPAHRAGPDAYVTAFLARELLARHPLETLIAWSAEPALQVRCHIGKWRGTPWSEVDTGFLYWVRDRDFGEDILFTVQHELARRQAAAAARADR